MQAGARVDRFESLDLLRGFAVLGIAMVNVQYFAMIYQAGIYPPAMMSLEGANLHVWMLMHAFFEFKFITLFSALFGAGILLFAGEGEAVARPHVRRMLWLMLFGAIHGFIIWYGDILLPYAVIGLIAVLFRKRQPRTLFLAGAGFIAISALLTIGSFAAFMIFPPDTAPETMGLALAPDALADVVARYQAGFLNRLGDNALVAVIGYLGNIPFFGPRLLGVMLIGMALYKTGFLTAQKSVLHYLAGAAVTLVPGFALAGWGAGHAAGSGFAPQQLWVHMSTGFVSSLVIAYGYACLVMLLAKAAGPLARAIQAPFAATGRMAFTNYLSQSLIFTLIFVGTPGLGLFGTVERSGQVAIVLGVWVLQLIWSPLWLSMFRYGPMEWLWRSLTYGSLQPIRR